MSFMKNNINIYIFFISTVMIISSSEINITSNYCEIDKYCTECTYCGNGTNDYTPCSYYNLFCMQKISKGIVFQEFYLKEYSTFFRSMPNANEVCGQATYTFNSLVNSFSIINKSYKDIKNSNINHCNYEINNIKYFNNYIDEANLTIKFKTNNPEKNNLKLNFNILLQNSRLFLAKLLRINETGLMIDNYQLNLYNYDAITILLDFYVDKEINASIDGYLEINIDTYNPSIKRNRIILIVIIVIFSLLIFSIIGIIICVYYRRKKIHEMIRAQLQQEEIIKKQKVEKINKLFENILIPKEFNENDVTNDCTECAICIEKFVDKCLICVTPCKHIFHYECLSKYIDTAKIKQKPVIKCPLCNYDFLEEEKDNKKLNEINNVNNEINNNQINNNETNNNETNNNENNEQNNSPPVGARVINENCVDQNITSKEELNNKI